MKKSKIVILSGAGMSAESGISTFRDSDGLWENHRVEDVASIEGFERNPQLVLDFYNARRLAYKGCKPNKGHLGLVDLEEKYEVVIVTQNIDNLHEDAGSKKVIHLHGELMKNRSALSDTPTYEVDPDSPCLKVGDLAPDGSQLRPFIVWFGEAVPKIEKAIEEIAAANIVIIIGTSLNVYPAAGLLHYAPQEAKIYLIDPHPNIAAIPPFVEVIKEKASTGVEEIKRILL